VRITVRVPATSANLGPGFDCFGLALDLCNEVIVDTDAEPGVTWEGEGADELPTDGTDMVSRVIAEAVERICTNWRRPNATIPAMALRGVNRIPLARGLGSSAAATVAGVQIARVLLEADGLSSKYLSSRYLTHVAGELEGHYDNVAAAMVGGFTIAVDGSAEPFDRH